MTAQTEAIINSPFISQEQWDSLCRAVLEGCRKFYSDPENVRKYEEWKAQKDAQRQKA